MQRCELCIGADGFQTTPLLSCQHACNAAQCTAVYQHASLNSCLPRIAPQKFPSMSMLNGIMCCEQGVNLDFSADTDREWRPDEKRRSTVVFIGKELQEDKLRKGLEACLVKETKGGKKKKSSLPVAS